METELDVEGLLKRFWEDGYMVIPAIFSTAMMDAVLQSVKDHDEAAAIDFRSIFKTVGSKTFDKFRLQAPLKHRAYDDLKKEVNSLVSLFNMRWKPTGWVALKSLAGGEAQDPHKDVPAFEIAEARAKYDKTIQAGLIVGMMKGTTLIVYPKCFAAADPNRRTQIELGAGDCIIFRGDLVHCGAAFTELNYRIHCMLTVKGIKWRNGTTEAAPPTVFKCRFCEFMADTKRRVRNHLKRCRDNPTYAAKRARERELNARGKDCPVCKKHHHTINACDQHFRRRHRPNLKL